jgi:outer membrane receptor protein involved in Fe transport
VFGNNFVNQLLVNYTDSEQFFSRTDCGFAPGPGECPTHTFPAVRIGPQPNVGFELHNWFMVRNDASYFVEMRGRHNVKFGGEVTRGHVIIFFPNATNGVFFYNQNPPNLATCCAGADQTTWDKSQFPIPVRYNVGLGDFQTKAPNTIYAAYLQDDWTITPRLTLNLGLRYDLEVGSLAHDQLGLAVAPSKNDVDNVQPRLGFAWDFLGNGRTVIRGGGGKYYDQVYLNLTYNQRLQNSGQNVNVTTFNTTNNPNFINDPLGGRGFEELKNAGGLRNVSRIQSGAEQPHTWSSSIGLAHQLTPSTALAADYVYQRSGAMLVNVDSNLFCCTANGFPLPLTSGNYPDLGGFVAGAGRPDPNFGSITDYTFQGRARYHGLQLALTKRLSNNHQYGVTYLLSKNEDTSATANNPFDIGSEFGRSSQDQRHRLTANWVVRLPYRFNFNGILFAASGQALGTSTGGVDINGDSSTGGDRPICGLDPRFNPGCAALGIANGERVPRNPHFSDRVTRLDIRLSRTFQLNGFRMEPLIEVFNVFNRENYDPGTYQISLANATFGAPGRSSGLPYQPRQIQLGAKVTF